MMSKIKFLLGVLLLATTATMAQSGVKLYGYEQDESPGMISSGTSENGSNTGFAHTSYFIYLAAPSKVEALEIWIRGKKYSVASQEKVKSPVSTATGAKKSTVLVNQKSGTILKLVPTEYTEGKTFSKAAEKARSNEMVVVYKSKGSYYSATLKKITRLEPVMNE